MTVADAVTGRNRQVCVGVDDAERTRCRNRATTTGWSCSERAVSVKVRWCCASFAGRSETPTYRRSKTRIDKSSAATSRLVSSLSVSHQVSFRTFIVVLKVTFT